MTHGRKGHRMHLAYESLRIVQFTREKNVKLQKIKQINLKAKDKLNLKIIPALPTKPQTWGYFSGCYSCTAMQQGAFPKALLFNRRP